MHYALLPHRGLICLSGEETLPFLQGLVSNDVMRLTQTGIVYAALLSPQGKFLHDFFLINQQGSVLIDCEKPRLADLLKRLNLYRLRSKVTMEAMPENRGVIAIWGEDKNLPKAESMMVFPDPRLKELGWRVVGECVAMEEWCRGQGMEPADAAAYDRMRLEAGVPDGSRDLVVDKSTLLPFGFEPLHGVNFTKGCYVGQEVTARMKHIGQVRKFLHKVTSLGGNLPSSGAPILLGDEPAGTLCSHTGGIGLALMTSELVEKARQGHLDFHCGDVIVKVELPKWAR